MEEVAFTRHMRESWDQEELGSTSQSPKQTPPELAQAVLPAPNPAAPVFTGAPLPQDPHVDQYEAKEWTFIIENVSGQGGRELGVSGTLGQH